MIIDFKSLTHPQLTEVTADISELLTKKPKNVGTFDIWYQMLKGIIRETDRRIDEDLQAEIEAERQQAY